MQLHQPSKHNQSGFSVIEVLLVVLVVAALAVTGFVVYQHHKPSSTKNSAATGSTQTTNQQQNTTSTQPQTTTYLFIKEWGVKIPLSSPISDAYYVSGIGSIGSDGVTNQIYLGLTSLDSSGCIAAVSNHGQDSAPAMIFRSKPSDVDPVTNKTYSQEYPDGVTIGNYFYGFESFANSSNISTCKAPHATIQSVDSAFATAAKGIVSATTNQTATQYLYIKELGIRFKLSAAIEDTYYAVKPNTQINGKPIIALYLHSLDAYPLCAPAGNPDGVAAISNFTPGQTDPVHGDFYTSFPNAPLIGGLHYYIENEQFDCSEGKSNDMDAISQAFKAGYPTIEAYTPN